MMSLKGIELEKYIDIVELQAAKIGNDICGDVIVCQRTPEATTVILCDGLGSGVKANLVATMTAARLAELLRLDFSLRHACQRVIATMHAARTEDVPFAAFTVARIRRDGYATVLVYEMPPPLLIEDGLASVQGLHFSSLGYEVVGELSIMVKPQDVLVFVSDGVSQAGLGSQQYRLGWTVGGASVYMNDLLSNGVMVKDIPNELFKNIRSISAGGYGDDTSVVMLSCRESSLLQILTGLPENRIKDDIAVKGFNLLSGKKAICGSTTAEVVGRVLERKVEAFKFSQTYYQPPQYAIGGFELVSEGAITLNQAYNILDADWSGRDLHSCVLDLCCLMKEADCINFWVGGAVNSEHQDLVFKQMNILPRRKIVGLLADKLKSMGKLVTVEYL
jgi:hypothetical protein